MRETYRCFILFSCHCCHYSCHAYSSHSGYFNSNINVRDLGDIKRDVVKKIIGAGSHTSIIRSATLLTNERLMFFAFSTARVAVLIVLSFGHICAFGSI